MIAAACHVRGQLIYAINPVISFTNILIEQLFEEDRQLQIATSTLATVIVTSTLVDTFIPTVAVAL